MKSLLNEMHTQQNKVWGSMCGTKGAELSRVHVPMHGWDVFILLWEYTTSFSFLF